MIKNHKNKYIINEESKASLSKQEKVLKKSMEEAFIKKPTDETIKNLFLMADDNFAIKLFLRLLFRKKKMAELKNIKASGQEMIYAANFELSSVFTARRKYISILENAEFTRSQ